MAPTTATTRIALLICGGLSGAALAQTPGDYLDIYTRFLQETFPSSTCSSTTSSSSSADGPPSPGNAQKPFTLDPYFVARDGLVDPKAYPDPEAYDALVLTGSAANAYDDTPWIVALAAYIKRVAEDVPRVRIIGICFGHQLIARALGGACVPNAGHWEIGPTRVQLTSLGRRVFGGDGEMTIQQMHRDHVPELPPTFHLLGSTTVSPVQGMVRFTPSTQAPSSSSSSYPSDTADATLDINLLRSVQILTVQGHPEFTEPVISAIVSQRAASGAIDVATASDYNSHRREWTDDGRGRIARAVWGVVLGGV